MKAHSEHKALVDRPFNLAGMVRGVLFGIFCGVVLLTVMALLGEIIFGQPGMSDFVFSAICAVTLLLVVLFGFHGAGTKPKEITETTKKWVASTWISGRMDAIIPESITLRILFKTMLLYILILAIGVAIASMYVWWQGSH